MLIAARAFLAVGAAAMLPATLSLIRITFDDEHERGLAIGVWGTMAVLAPRWARSSAASASALLVGLGLPPQHPVVLLALAATVAFVPGGSGHRDRPGT